MKFQAKYALALVPALLISPIFCSSPVLAAQIRAPGAGIDNGVAPAADEKDVFLSLKVPDRAALEAFVASTVDRSSANYRKFLTPAQFKERFGQPDAAVSRVRALLVAHGLTVTKVYNNNLVISARGTNAQMTELFGSAIHSFTENGETYQRPAGEVSIPASVRDVVANVAGLSTKAIYRSGLRTIPSRDVVNRTLPGTIPTPGLPGQYTVNDLAAQVDITPLYNRGLTGAGTTLGIMTFASFKTTDVSAYWSGVGLSGDTTRITTINTVPGKRISSSGADETTLDVEQSGGLAPGANVIVYEAPNSSSGELALYTQAITDNIADTLSISWGAPEVEEGSSSRASLDTLFLQSAAQGVPISAASADSGAYDLNNAQVYPYPDYSATLSVDFPSSSPYVLAAGGTTLPGVQVHKYASVNVPAERPWAWDYLSNYITTYYGQAYFYANFYPVGDGGGVSVSYPLPTYQTGLAGTMVSAAGQTLFCFASPAVGQPCTPGQVIYSLPGGFAGRNTPDVSLNADPYTGYSLYFSGAWSTGSGGTSFVAPQLNGIFALITEQKGGRLGWLHPQLYSAFAAQGYATGSPFRSITSGTNWFYHATPSFNPATGIGTLDVNNLANALAE